MFIVKYKDGSEATGDQLVWDDVKADEDNYITGMHLTLPFIAQQQNADGSFTRLPARTISLSGYHRWYYGKEALSAFFAPQTGLDDSHSQPNDVADIVGGIDDRNGLVFQIRVARDGNITTNRFPLAQLEHEESSIRIGQPLKK
jgi:hypothetical protein